MINIWLDRNAVLQFCLALTNIIRLALHWYGWKSVHFLQHGGFEGPAPDWLWLGKSLKSCQAKDFEDVHVYHWLTWWKSKWRFPEKIKTIVKRVTRMYSAGEERVKTTLNLERTGSMQLTAVLFACFATNFWWSWLFHGIGQKIFVLPSLSVFLN